MADRPRTSSQIAASTGRARTSGSRTRSSIEARHTQPPPSRLAGAIRQAYSGRLTQMQLAHELGVAQNTVSRWSTGDVEPRLEDIARVEHACGLPRGFILRAAGFVDEGLNPEDAIAADHRLDQPRRDLLLAAYRAAVSQSKRRG